MNPDMLCSESIICEILEKNNVNFIFYITLFLYQEIFDRKNSGTMHRTGPLEQKVVGLTKK